MKPYLRIISLITLCLFTSLVFASPKENNYSEIKYNKKQAKRALKKLRPQSILIAPVINQTGNVEIGRYLQSHLPSMMSKARYYILPNMLTTELLRSSDTEEVVDNTFPTGMHQARMQSILNFAQNYGADAVLFTQILMEKNSRLVINLILLSSQDAEILWKLTRGMGMAKTKGRGGSLMSGGGGGEAVLVVLAILILLIPVVIAVKIRNARQRKKTGYKTYMFRMYNSVDRGISEHRKTRLRKGPLKKTY